jgi:hypothetical protein
MNNTLWNLLQRGRGILHMQPLGCHSQKNGFCVGCEPGQFYQCQTCGYLQPWCKGALNTYEEICDDCWAIAEQMHDAASIPIEGGTE